MCRSGVEPCESKSSIDDECPTAHVDTWKHYVKCGEGDVAEGLRELRRQRNVADSLSPQEQRRAPQRPSSLQT